MTLPRHAALINQKQTILLNELVICSLMSND